VVELSACSQVLMCSTTLNGSVHITTLFQSLEMASLDVRVASVVTTRNCVTRRADARGNFYDGHWRFQEH
jgi:hypothetical protein